MTTTIADSIVVPHRYHRDALTMTWYRDALTMTWYGSLVQPLDITPITWMEVMYGDGSKITPLHGPARC